MVAKAKPASGSIAPGRASTRPAEAQRPRMISKPAWPKRGRRAPGEARVAEEDGGQRRDREGDDETHRMASPESVQRADRSAPPRSYARPRIIPCQYRRGSPRFFSRYMLWRSFDWSKGNVSRGWRSCLPRVEVVVELGED